MSSLKGDNAAWLLKAKLYRTDIRFQLSSKYLKGTGLEIGAGAVPLQTAGDAKTEYLDYAPKTFIAQHFGISEDQVLCDLVGSMESIPAKANTYDFVAASHVLEHLEDPIRGLKEVFRVLKKEGVLFLVVPNIKSSEFDFNRNVLPISHFIEEHENEDIKRNNKLVHYREFVSSSQIKPDVNLKAYESRVEEFIESDRRIHFHAYGPRLLIALINHVSNHFAVEPKILDSFYFEFSNELILVLKFINEGKKTLLPLDFLLTKQNESKQRLLKVIQEKEGEESAKRFFV